jgi:ketosteroid isomerase-like protein
MVSVFVTIVLAISLRSGPDDAGARAQADRAALARTGDIIRDAFARGDVQAAMACHHPAVEKSFTPDSRLVGRSAVEANLAETLAANRLEFLSSTVESLMINGDLAVEQSLFAIRGTPKAGGTPWTFRGRTQVVYVRDASNPCGWATIRELVQPAG